MATIASLAQVGDDAPEPKRWTVDEYLRMYEFGMLPDEGERFELLDGEVLRKLGQNEPHVISLMVAADALRLAFGPGFHVSQQIPVRLGDVDRPEPDIVVLQGSARDFDGRRVTSEHIALVVEIADSRLDTARGPKVRIYARHRIQEYWIVDLRRRVVEVRRGPTQDSDWTETRIYSENESIAPLLSPNAVAVSDLLPRIQPEESQN